MTLEQENSTDASINFEYIPKTPLTKSWSYYTPVPDACVGSDEGVMLGVDEAGRGPVLGPMVYAVAYCPISKKTELKDVGVQDSKVLNEQQRDGLLSRIQQHHQWLGWAVHVCSPQDISASMLQQSKYNLNALAHDTTIGLIRGCLERRVPLTEVYVDTVGPPQQYQDKLQALFPKIKITVAKKADSLYPVVSAASICAKVTRDQILHSWSFIEKGLDQDMSKQFGSGYPSDPNTVKWLTGNIDPIFGYPRLIRFSWQTCEKYFDAHCCPVKWSTEPIPDDGADIRKMFAKGKTLKRSATEDEPSAAAALKSRDVWITDILGLEHVHSL